jgi:S-adenosylmethionine hydrolase
MAITLTTDFGDVYPAIMKGVILSIDPDAVLVDISHSIRPGDIYSGAFILQFASRHFPAGSVHLAVVDPGVGSPRRALVIKGERHSFVGPDNGILMPAARAQGKFKAYEIADLSFYTKKVSPVFHGRDVFAPAAAFLSEGIEIPCLNEISDPVDLDFGVPELKDGKIAGKAVYVDGFGNVVTNIGGEALSGLLRIGETPDVNGVDMTFVRAYCEVPKCSLVLLVGSHGMAEIACNGDSASALMELEAGDSVVITPSREKPIIHGI